MESMMGWNGEVSRGALQGMALWMGAWGLITGAVVLVGAFQVRAHPEAALPWGLAILIAGALSFFGMGGFFFGGVAAVTGGVLAVAAARPGGEPARARQEPGT